MEGSIPRRVKKLSWDDDNDENENVNDNIQVCLGCLSRRLSICPANEEKEKRS